ncbi:MAG: ABC transporter permease [Actinomycetota bacterium]|nr:ABC transporter permease [Actinomycetota bacterium]
MTATTAAGGPKQSAAQAELSRRSQSPLQRVQHLLHGHPWISPLLLLVLTIVVFSIVNPRFLLANSLSLLVQQTAVVAALALGQTLIILTAGIDLSVGAIAILSTMIMASLAANNGVPGVLALIIGIAFGFLAGYLNGLLVTKINLPPFIVTLGTLSIFTALALLYSGGSSIQDNRLPDIINWAGKGFTFLGFRLTTGVVIVLVMYLVVGFALSQTAWGRHVYAVGDDPESARLSGIASNRVLVSVYAVAGLIFGISAWVLIGRSGGATPNAITDGNLQSITAVVIGGTSLFGGRGGVAGTLLGALIVYAFTFGLSLAGVDQQYRVLAIGVLVIVAVAIDQWIRKVKG